MKKTTHADPSGFFYQRTCREGPPEGRLAGALPGLPLTAAVLDRYCAPYICGYGAGARPVASLESFLRSDLRTLGMHPENPAVWDRFIDQLYIFNYREDPQGHPIPQSVGTCFGAGWWCASFRVSALFPEGDPLEHTEQAEALLALLGSPTKPTGGYDPYYPAPGWDPWSPESIEPEKTQPQLERVPTGCTYTTADGEEYGPGEEIPRAPVEGDVLTSADYTYTLRNNDWLVRVRDTSKTSYEELLPVVNGLALRILDDAFERCASMTKSPRIPNTVVSMHETFRHCRSLTEAPALPENVVSLQYTFCSTSIVEPPVIPSSVQNMFATFSDCHSLKRAPVIPENVTSLRSTFSHCWVLEGTIVINAKLPDYPQKPETIQSCFLVAKISLPSPAAVPIFRSWPIPQPTEM